MDLKEPNGPELHMGGAPRGAQPTRAGYVMTHKCRGSIIVLSIIKSVEPNEEQKEMTSSF